MEDESEVVRSIKIFGLLAFVGLLLPYIIGSILAATSLVDSVSAFELSLQAHATRYLAGIVSMVLASMVYLGFHYAFSPIIEERKNTKKDGENQKKAVAINILHLFAGAFVIVVILLLLVLGYLFVALPPDQSMIECGPAIPSEHQERGLQLKSEWLQKNITSWEGIPEEEREKVINQTKRNGLPANYTINWYEDTLSTRRSHYDELSERNKRLFVRSINNTTDVSKETISSFLQRRDIYAGNRHIVYKGKLYTCYNGYPRGA